MFAPCVFRLQYTVKSFVKWGTSCQQSKLAETVTFAGFIRNVHGFNRGNNKLPSDNTQIIQENVEILHKIMQGDS